MFGIGSMINTAYLCARQWLTIPTGADKMKFDNFKIKSADQFLSVLSSGAVSSIVCSNHSNMVSFRLRSKVDKTFTIVYFLGSDGESYDYEYSLPCVPLRVAYFTFLSVSKQKGYDLF